jgi:hypothetical protein
MLRYVAPVVPFIIHGIMPSLPRYEVTEDYLKSERSLYTGLLGVSIVTSIELAGASSIDTALIASISAFTVAIPLLCFSLYAVMQEAKFTYSVQPLYLDLANAVGVLAAYVGLLTLFFHVSFAMGGLFFGTSICSFVCGYRFHEALLLKNENPEAA